MKTIPLGRQGQTGPAIALGCMRMAALSERELDTLVGTAIDCGVTFFDHADIYGRGDSEAAFGALLKRTPSLRGRIHLQSKCGIRKEPGGTYYDFSKSYLLAAVDGILSRLGVDHLDSLLLHRPDPLMEPEEVAEAFSQLEQAGKVRQFGVSNFNTRQLMLLQSAVQQPLQFNQLQFSLMHTGMLDHAVLTNTKFPGAEDRDGEVLDYCRLNGITLQAWSPFQYGCFEGVFVDNEKFPALNKAMEEVGASYGLSKTAVAVAWLLRHPAQIQVLVGTTNPARLRDFCTAADVTLSRADWNKLYCAAGNRLP